MVKKGKNSYFKEKRIIITDGKNGLPYSKGLMASSVMATGITPSQSYRVAQMIQDQLRTDGIFSVTTKELIDITAEALRAKVGEEYAEKYLRWQALSRIDKPLILLIGGATGVGKSTIATEVAHRLGVRRIVQTDAIREVMRAVFSQELMPTLYYSSFEAWRGLRAPLTSESDPVIVGFEEQISTVAVGLRAVIERAMRESLDVVIEGVHVVPGFIEPHHFKDAFVFPIVIKVDDPQLHKSHFYVRDPGLESHRPFRRYLENFANIRKIGGHIENLANKKNIPVITCYSLDATISSIIEVIYNTVFDTEKRLAHQTAKEELYEDFY
jgi:2-phosphoglycerate kinase